MKKFLLMVVIGFFTSCTNPEGAREVLENQGYTDVQIGGYGFCACSKDDTFATEFTAKSQNGKLVSGVVCSGFLKGSTIRFY